ncbi:MAG: hypothetical protein WBI04_09115, partial [Trichlorobacter sp.]
FENQQSEVKATAPSNHQQVLGRRFAFTSIHKPRDVGSSMDRKAVSWWAPQAYNAVRQGGHQRNDLRDTAKRQTATKGATS